MIKFATIPTYRQTEETQTETEGRDRQWKAEIETVIGTNPLIRKRSCEIAETKRDWCDGLPV